MSKRPTESDQDLKAKILRLLDEGRIMSVGTLRADGWPQVTTVGYVHTDLVLFFAVDSTSQKFRNVQRDPRVSIAIAFAPTGSRQGRGLSMAALASQVVEHEEVARINELLAKSYFGRALFAPRGASAVVLRAKPTIISLVDASEGRIEPQVFQAPDSPPASQSTGLLD